MYNSPFMPQGPTYFVGASQVQIPTSAMANGSQSGPTAYRVVNKSAAEQYLTWSSVTGVSAAGAPSGSGPVSFTVGMLGGTVEIFGGLGKDLYFIASSSTGFEVTPGEGL